MRMSRCRTFYELIVLQSELMQENIEWAMVGSRRIAQASTQLTTEAARTFADEAAKVQARAA
jgi:Phasin protein